MMKPSTVTTGSSRKSQVSSQVNLSKDSIIGVQGTPITPKPFKQPAPVLTSSRGVK